jgi:hypothetical protein
MSITSPADGFIVTAPEVVFQGTASDPSGVVGVDFGVDRPDGTGFGGEPATGTTSWSADVQGLAGGTNTVWIRGSDIQGNVTVVTNHIYFLQQTPLTVSVNGAGAVKPNLNGRILETGKWFKMTEKPAKGSVFAGWTGDIMSRDATLKFLMRSNLVIQANFVPTPFVPAAGTYKGGIAPLDKGALLSGQFKVKITKAGNFTAKFNFGDQTCRLSGAFLADGFFNGSITRKGPQMIPFSLQLQLDVTAHTLTGSMNYPYGGLTAAMLFGAKVSK